MKHVRFYIDSGPYAKWTVKAKDNYQGLALLYENVCPDGSMECVSGVTFAPVSGDGPYCSGAVCRLYIQEHCRRISESKARKMFPNLMKRMDA